MIFLRACFPIGGVIILLAVLYPYVWITDDQQFIKTSGVEPMILIMLIYVLSLFCKLKEALQASIVIAFLSSIYGVLVIFFPLINFRYSGYAYSFLWLVLIIVSSIYDSKTKQKVVTAYFVFRQMGTIQDVVRETGFSEHNVMEVFRELLKEEKIELFITTEDGNELYKWTENTFFAEGMVSEEIEI